MQVNLETSVRDDNRLRLGALLTEIGRAVGGVDLGSARDRTPHEPLDLGEHYRAAGRPARLTATP